ncbi:MAG: hypothetical protein JST39_07490, partial [Bacteroidetes bacterium]|nr:hypothetical protein [Bacteroidota bacterium]
WLRWSPVATANGFNILRSTTKDGPYATIATFRGTYPLYEDTSVTNGTAYFYAVSAINQAGTSGRSAIVNAMPVAAGVLPSEWQHQDIGTIATAGSAGYANASNGTFVVSGAGAGIGGAADGLSYVCKAVTGDVTITARVVANTWNGGGAQKTGLMIRQSLAADAITCSMTSGDGGVREAKFGSRVSPGSPMDFCAGNAYTRSPAWFRLKKSGNMVTAYQSGDGTTWHIIGSPVTVSMSGTWYVGLAVSSNNAHLNTATFDNVTVSGDLHKGRN